MAPYLQTNLMTETWPNGPGKMNSSCGRQFRVENVDELDFRSAFRPAVDFTTRHDHAKWAVSSERKGDAAVHYYVCVGDINRMETQKRRAGGTVCFDDKGAWKAFSSLIKSVETCKRSYFDAVLNILSYTYD